MTKNFTLLALPLVLASNLVSASDQDMISYSLFGGLTNGGDYFASDIVDTYTNASIVYHNSQNPDNQLALPEDVEAVESSNYPNLRAGGFAVVGAGVNFKVSPKVDVQLNLGYHWDRKEDPALKLSRFELELIPYYQLNERIRIGFGVTHHFNNHFGNSDAYSAHSQQQLELGLNTGTAAGDPPQNNYDVVSAALFTQLSNYQQLLEPGQTPYDEDDLAMGISHKLGNGTGWVGSVTYDWPKYNSRFEFRLVSISYYFDTEMALFERTDAGRTSLISSNTRQTVDGNHAGLYYHWIF